jgi:hypothetical protein
MMEDTAFDDSAAFSNSAAVDNRQYSLFITAVPPLITGSTAFDNRQHSL